ncbi:FAD-dependent thymidylate synthase [Oceanimonas pelagia]|uniref:FAD-dependent thymidylate synthase n=1 Tax=Oceanimonas pelagia TaxID=3028314 RepID=A0AA50KM98_9GAMM|nr:FAD-dependent thymidylate synthase [Oceanimonas pelagia]WMC09575.1 FAD-dependent thymidylate synthase [Oceanimonas pelagia]
MITADLITHSICSQTGTQLRSFLLEYPRFIHAELMTHRVFSRNSASSRAIPITTVMQLVEADPAMPIHWGADQPGMQARQEVEDVEGAREEWLAAMRSALFHAERMRKKGLHKQIVNRLLEPFQRIKVLVSSTDMANWYALRHHPDAQPEIECLAALMFEAEQSSTPFELHQGEWHLPFIDRKRNDKGELLYYSEGELVSLDSAKRISASCAAQTSYRKNDTSEEKAGLIFQKLVESLPVHASPFEHQAQAFPGRSSNFRNFRQFRKEIANETVKDAA